MKCVEIRSLLTLRSAIVVAWALVLAALVVIIGPGNIIASYSQVTPQQIKDYVINFGALSVLVFLAASIIRPFFFLPPFPFTIASGFLFGFWQGLLWAFVGATLSSILTFLLSRYLLYGFIMKRYAGKYRWVDRVMEDRGWTFIVFLRLIPVLPSDFVGYIAGISHVTFSDYLLGTVIGEIPGTVVLVLLGTSLDEIGSTTFYLSIVLAAVVWMVPTLLRKWVDRRRKKYEEEPDTRS